MRALIVYIFFNMITLFTLSNGIYAQVFFHDNNIPARGTEITSSYYSIFMKINDKYLSWQDIEFLGNHNKPTYRPIFSNFYSVGDTIILIFNVVEDSYKNDNPLKLKNGLSASLINNRQNISMKLSLEYDLLEAFIEIRMENKGNFENKIKNVWNKYNDFDRHPNYLMLKADSCLNLKSELDSILALKFYLESYEEGNVSWYFLDSMLIPLLNDQINKNYGQINFDELFIEKNTKHFNYIDTISNYLLELLEARIRKDVDVSDYYRMLYQSFYSGLHHVLFKLERENQVYSSFNDDYFKKIKAIKHSFNYGETQERKFIVYHTLILLSYDIYNRINQEPLKTEVRKEIFDQIKYFRNDYNEYEHKSENERLKEIEKDINEIFDLLQTN